MKLMIASDLHGSGYYCEKLIERYREEKPDKLVLLGDLLYHGPRNELPREYAPKKVITMLNELADKIVCVRGNCEAEVDQMVLDFPVMADYAVLMVDGKTVYITHGHVVNSEKPLPFAEGDILLHGHTHVPACQKQGTWWYLNPGSAAIPKENSGHSYMLYRDGEFVWKDIETGEEYRREKV